MMDVGSDPHGSPHPTVYQHSISPVRAPLQGLALQETTVYQFATAAHVLVSVEHAQASQPRQREHFHVV